MGLDPVECAQRYLSVDSRYGAQRLHKAVVDRARGIARQVGLRDARLIGMTVRSDAPGVLSPPPLEDWALDNGYDGLSEAELTDLYAQAFPPNPRQARIARLRERQAYVLRQVELAGCAEATRSDRIDDWFERRSAARLMQSGMLLLGELQDLIVRGGRWWRDLPAVGAAKAARTAAYLNALLPEAPRAVVPWTGRLPVLEPGVAQRLDGSTGENRGTGQMVSAQTDAQIIETWIRVRGVNPITAKSYRREVRRLYLWAVTERHKALSSLNADDCQAYVAFLADIPPAWLGTPAPLTDSQRWCPFAKQLSAASRRQAHGILKSFFDWMRRAGYLRENPWELIGLRVPDDARAVQALLSTRAFTPAAWAAIERYLDAAGRGGQAHARTRFVFRFCAATGLRAHELLNARIGDLRAENGYWVLLVLGKGAKGRAVVLVSAAVKALEDYLTSRGLPGLLQCAGTPALHVTPLVVSAIDPLAPLGYQSLYASVKATLRHALRTASLPMLERQAAQNASPHWLRHTFGTRASERLVSDAVIMAQMGHADARSSKRYTRAQIHRMKDELAAAFAS
jgi:integrase